jgi:hypothetical protein
MYSHKCTSRLKIFLYYVAIVTVLRPRNVNVVVILYFIILAANVCPISRMMTCVCVSVIYYTFSEIHQYILILGLLHW